MIKKPANIGFLSILIILLSLSTFACGQGGGESVMEEVSSKYAEFVPFKITGFDGSTIDLAKLRGSVVVVNFWASWCGPCKIEAGELEVVYKKYKDKGVHIVGIAIDDTEAGARAFIEHYKVTYPNAIDSDNSLASRYQMFVIPTTFVIDKAGLIRYKRQGAITRESLEKEILKLL